MNLEPLAIVVAVSKNGVIGKAGKMPWHIPQDLKHFRDLTKDHAIIMGRKTWESIGSSPLPNRTNIVVSKTMADAERGAAAAHPFSSSTVTGYTIASTLDEAIRLARLVDKEPRIIGGAQLYTEALPLATVVYLTSVMQTIDGCDAAGSDLVKYPTSPIEWKLREQPKPGPGFVWMILERNVTN